VKIPNLTTVALKGCDSVVVVTQKKVPDKLMCRSSITNVYNISPTTGCVMTGLTADARRMVMEARQEAAKFKDANSFEMPVASLAERMAALNQVNTQQAGMRPTGCMPIFYSYDEIDGPTIWMVDPAGFARGYKGCAAGPKQQEATNLLEKIVKKDGCKSSFSRNETLQNALFVLQSVTGVDFKPQDVEVSVVDKDNKSIQRLRDSEVEDLLNQVAENDNF